MASDDSAPTFLDDEAEQRARRSLGLGVSGGTRGAQPRRRFVRDGEVPVVVLHPRSEAETRQAAALAELTAQLNAEREARARVEQALRDSQAVVRSLQTRLAHTEMAHAAPPPALLTPASLPTAPAIPPAVAAETAARPAKAPATGTMEPAPRAKRGRPRKAASAAAKPASEAKPVKWWTGNYRARDEIDAD